jgi:polyferredoxin
MILYSIRRIIQMLTLGGILLCWLDFWIPAAAVLPWLPRFSPLMMVTTRLAARQWTPYFTGGMLIAFTALLLPRFFCGWLCPLGTCIDLTDTITLARKRGMLLASRWWIATIVCAGLIIAAAMKYDVAGFADPLTLVTHTLAYTGFSESFATLQQQLGGGAENLGRVMFGIVGAILMLTVLGRRSWCRLLCPLGGMLGVLSWTGLTRRRVNNECIHCGKCSRECKMGAISRDGLQTTDPSCIFCNACVKICPKKAIRFE